MRVLPRPSVGRPLVVALTAAILGGCQSKSDLEAEQATARGETPSAGAQIGTAAGDSAALAVFQADLEQGASCEVLFESRNRARPRSPEKEEMGRHLGRVGCTHVSTTRRPLPTGEDRAGGFTVREYRIYRALLTPPMSVPESDAFTAVGREHSVPADSVAAIADRIQRFLFAKGELGPPEREITFAADWSGEWP